MGELSNYLCNPGMSALRLFLPLKKIVKIVQSKFAVKVNLDDLD